MIFLYAHLKLKIFCKSQKDSFFRIKKAEKKTLFILAMNVKIILRKKIQIFSYKKVNYNRGV